MGKSLNVPVPLFPHLYYGENQDVHGINEFKWIKHLEKGTWYALYEYQQLYLFSLYLSCVICKMRLTGSKWGCEEFSLIYVMRLYNAWYRASTQYILAFTINITFSLHNSMRRCLCCPQSQEEEAKAHKVRDLLKATQSGPMTPHPRVPELNTVEEGHLGRLIRIFRDVDVRTTGI